MEAPDLAPIETTIPWGGRPTLPNQVQAALLAQPWMTVPDLARWLGRHPVSARAAVRRLIDRQELVRVEMTALAWPGRHGSTLVAPATTATATAHRLLRLEQTRLLTTLLARFDPGGRRGLRAALRGEPDGPPAGTTLLRLADAERRGVLVADRLRLAVDDPFAAAVAGLADAWLTTPDGHGALLARWDPGDGEEMVERAWLALLGRLERVISAVAIVCAQASALVEWHRRWQMIAHAPTLVVAWAGALTDEVIAWYDGHGRLVRRLAERPDDGATVLLRPTPFRPPAGAEVATWPRHGLTRALARRQALSSTALAALRAIARSPLIGPAALVAEREALYLGRDDPPLSPGRMRQVTGELLAAGLVARAGRELVGLYATPAGLRLLAAQIGIAPALYRRLTVLQAGRLPAEGACADRRVGRSTPRLRRARQHLAHTQGIIALRAHFAGQTAPLSGGRLATIGAWEGPLCRTLRFRTDQAALQTRDARTGCRLPYGRLYPDARAVLQVGERAVDLVIEWDTGRTNLQTLREKLPHYLAWRAAPAGQRGAVLFVTPSPRRERQLQRVLAEPRPTTAAGPPGILTTTLARLTAGQAFGSIWAVDQTLQTRLRLLEYLTEW